MYRKRLVCAVYAQMNITEDQTRRLMYIVEVSLKDLVWTTFRRADLQKEREQQFLLIID